MTKCLEPWGAKVQRVLRKKAGVELRNHASRAVLKPSGASSVGLALEGVQGGGEKPVLLRQEFLLYTLPRASWRPLSN